MREVGDRIEMLHWSIMVKRELSVIARLPMYWLIYMPILIYSLKLWIVIETEDRSGGNELSPKGDWKRVIIQDGLRVELLVLHIKRS